MGRVAMVTLLRLCFCAGGVDYENMSPYRVEFRSGSTSAILGVPIHMDSNAEFVEHFGAVLTVPTASFSLGVRPGVADNATVEIQDTNEGMCVFLYALQPPNAAANVHGLLSHCSVL